MIEAESMDGASISNGTSKLPSFVDQVLHFLSIASNETLCACFAALGFATYLILGRVGLLLIGIACGVVAHANWENSSHTRNGLISGVIKARKKRETSIEVVNRVLDWRDEKAKKDGIVDEHQSFIAATSSEAAFVGFPEATKAALISLIDAIIRDYVKWWYDPTLWAPDESFPLACRQSLNQFLLAMSSYLSKKRPADTFLNFLTNTTAIFIAFLGELSGCLMSADSVDLEPHQAIQYHLQERPSSILAVMLDMTQQRKRFKEIADHMLQSFLDQKAIQCDPARIFLREVLGGIIFETSARACSQPEWINGWIVSLLEEGEPKILNAIDAGVDGMPVKDLTNGAGLTLPTDGELEGANVPAAPSSQTPQPDSMGHRRKISRAEDAMENAMQEAQRLTEMIAQEEARRTRSSDESILERLDETNPAPAPSQNDVQRPNDGRGSSNSHTSYSVSNDTAPPEIYSSFDQILSARSMGGPHSANGTTPSIPPMTLQNSNVVILDDSQPGEKASIRTKPTLDYLLQIEPASSSHQGWMIARKYTDFETLHEVLRRISVISGVSDFTLRYSAVPTWKGQTKDSLRISLEQYLHAALTHDALAESEGMKRFLEKDQTQTRVAGKGLLGFPNPEAFQSMGKGMLDVLSNAPKGAAGGGKALLEGVTGVFGQKKGASARATKANRSISMGSGSSMPEHQNPPRQGIMSDGQVAPDDLHEASLQSSRVMTLPPLPHRPYSIDQHSVSGTESYQPSTNELSQDPRSTSNQDTEMNRAAIAPESSSAFAANLPPPPSEIPDDYTSSTTSPRISLSINDTLPSQSSMSSPAPSLKLSLRQETSVPGTIVSSPSTSAPPKIKKDVFPPLSEQETQVAVELFFAVVNELYTLSSAWNIRRTLLNAAKTFLLRPGNPNLEAIRVLLQDTLVEANTSDAGLATHLTKLRENTLPTEAERASWPAPMTADEKEKLRIKARRLLIEKGMPQALTSVMGAAASGEALARVFDALQVEEVARGLMSALVLQGIRALTC